MGFRMGSGIASKCGSKNEEEYWKPTVLCDVVPLLRPYRIFASPFDPGTRCWMASITAGEQGRDRSSNLHPTLCSCFFPSFLTRLHSLSPNVMPVGGFPHRDRDQVVQADWASRRLQSVVAVSRRG